MNIDKIKAKLSAKREQLLKRNSDIAKKQIIVNELNKEKDEIRDLEKANKKAKLDLFKSSVLGRSIKIAGSVSENVAKGAAIAGKATGRFLNSENTKKAIRDSALALGQVTGLLNKTQVKKIKKKFK